MAVTKKAILMQFNGTDWDTIYLKTTADLVEESASKRFVTDAEKASWNAKLDASAYTAADVLTKLKTVDGSGSGLDADTLDGKHASDFLPSTGIDASMIKSGTIDIARMPKGALERLVVVPNDAARFALTTDDVQNGDTVKVVETNALYYVADDTKLNEEAGYEPYATGVASSVPWSGVTDRPTTLSGYGITDAAAKEHTHSASDINSGTLPVSRGGTGVSTITGIVKGNGTGAFTAAIPGTDYVVPSGSITGNAGTATKLANARAISLTGDVTGSANFDGSANVSINVTLTKALSSIGTTPPAGAKTGDIFFQTI